MQNSKTATPLLVRHLLASVLTFAPLLFFSVYALITPSFSTSIANAGDTLSVLAKYWSLVPVALIGGAIGIAWIATLASRGQNSSSVAILWLVCLGAAVLLLTAGIWGIAAQ